MADESTAEEGGGEKLLTDYAVTLTVDDFLGFMSQVLGARPEFIPALTASLIPKHIYPPASILKEERLQGTIKAFDPNKNYGFISSQAITERFGVDAFLHGRQLHGFTVGAGVDFAVALSKDQRPQAFDLRDLTAQNPKGGGKGHSPGKAAIPCKFYPNCYDGENCPFAHNDGAWAEPPSKPVQPKVVAPPGKPVQPQRTPPAQPVQPNWAQTMAQMMPESQPQQSLNQSAKPCHFFAQGTCKNGSNCPFSHDPSVVGAKTLSCKFFEAGNCQNGENCAYAHITRKRTFSEGPGAGVPQNFKEEVGSFIGFIKSLNPQKGFGFITCPSLQAMGHTQDVFLGAQNAQGHEAGTTVKFTVCLTHDNKLQAYNLEEPPGVQSTPAEHSLKEIPMEGGFLFPQEGYPQEGFPGLA